jgi:hypothetical protein
LGKRYLLHLLLAIALMMPLLSDTLCSCRRPPGDH